MFNSLRSTRSAISSFSVSALLARSFSFSFSARSFSFSARSLLFSAHSAYVYTALASEDRSRRARVSSSKSGRATPSGGCAYVCVNRTYQPPMSRALCHSEGTNIGIPVDMHYQR